MEEELERYYCLYECDNYDEVLKKMDNLTDSGKISYDIDDEILEIIDIDLTETDIKKLIKFFTENNVLIYQDRDIDDDSMDEYDDFFGEDYDF